MFRRPMFRDRSHAGVLLAELLKEYEGREDTVVLALPRGGVVVGFEVARALKAPLDVFVVRKLGVPSEPELAMGAIASGGVRVINEEVVAALNISANEIDSVAKDEQRELERREQAYRGDRAPTDVSGRIVILVDDGVATGSTIKSAIKAIAQRDPARLVLAVPVAPRSTFESLKNEVDSAVAVTVPEHFTALSAWYRDFPQNTDEEVRHLLQQAASQQKK